jgi:hypothetical protein
MKSKSILHGFNIIAIVLASLAVQVQASNTESGVITTLQGGNFTMSWFQNETGALQYFVRGSEDLREWGPASVNVVNAPAGGEIPEGHVRKQFSVPAVGRQFYRIVATDNPAAVPDASYTIQVAGAPVSVERWGTGPRAIVFFGYIPFKMQGNLKSAFADQFRGLVGTEYSMFLWTYPATVAPYSQAFPSLVDFFATNPYLALANRINFSGQASSVVEQIRSVTGLTEICLVGNSFGAGVIFWDLAMLANDANVRSVLISPSELFMPFSPPLANPLPRTVLVADAEEDFRYLLTDDAWQYVAARTTGPLPPDYQSDPAYPHFIIGQGQTSLEYVFGLIDAVYQQP